MPNITINEALVWQKTLRERMAELTTLRNENSATVTRYRGMGGDKEDKREPTYDAKALDKTIAGLHRELRRLDQCIKATNAVTPVVGYVQDDTVLGEL